MKVREIMTSPIHTVTSERSVQYVSDIMSELKIGSLVVVDYGKTVGIITSRDIRSSHPNRIVADSMTPEPVSILQDQFVWEALDIMEKHCIERLLVIDGEQTIGIVTRETVQIKLSQILDPLTGLYRAPYIQHIGEYMLNQRQPFQLLFIDLNNFGEINKVYGHPVGDDIIVGFSNHLRSSSDDRDYVCRYAGDEFVIITTRNEHDTLALVNSVSNPAMIHNINISAAVGLVNISLVTDFFTYSLRELISHASLQSTSIKRYSAS
ncbi:GGDEF domain-containing protein [Paenibacillus piri]|uniref:GGDEF domain-containing protein n=1 Tax=Paenibacillus piri TaxID=2547395 RepID=A0A4R5KVA9_9BACL|nr:GGDEF domain-containing protein [Paenibacillus piri]TDF99432.1 GGDEF domain-containing protein [Paenibacillus piri]